jgi:general secretion pathway protein J
MKRLRGFTLMEALVALILLSLLSLGLLTALRLGQRTYAQTARLEAEHWSITAAHRFLRRVLEDAYPFEPLPDAAHDHYCLEGRRDRLAVTAHMPLSSGGAGHFRYEIVPVDRADGARDLVVRATLDRPGASPTRTMNAAPSTREEVLVPRIDAIEWSYREGGAGASSTDWRSDWQARAALPALVRLRVVFTDGDPRLWPDLIVAPRITHDAGCEFDRISQRCRARGT